MVNDYYILFKFQVIINNSENLKKTGFSYSQFSTLI